jgi:hypothetical protein
MPSEKLKGYQLQLYEHNLTMRLLFDSVGPPVRGIFILIDISYRSTYCIFG